MSRQPVSFLHALEAQTKHDYAVALQAFGRKILFNRGEDFTDETYRVVSTYPTFEAVIESYAPHQDLDDDESAHVAGLEFAAVFLANFLESRDDDDPLKSYLLGIGSNVLVSATQNLLAIPLDVLIEKTNDWPVRFPAFAALLADLRASKGHDRTLHGALVLLIAVIDLAAQSSLTSSSSAED